MAKSKGRLLAELLASDGKVKESKSALDITGGKLAPSDIPTLPNSKLENSSISIAGHNTALGGSVTLNTGDIGEHTNYKYHTEARVRGSISATGSLSYNSTTGVMSFTMPAQNTSNITEGSNKYYTDARVGSYLSTNGYATQSTIVGAITDSAPGTLDTLNELAAALGDDANFSTTVTNSIATKLPLAGGTMTGTLNMGGNAFTGNNFNISGVNQLALNDPGEGILFGSNCNLYLLDDAADNILRLDAPGGFRLHNGPLSMGTTTVIDTSRNLTNIGTISSAKLTVNSGAGVSQFHSHHTTGHDDWQVSPISIRERGLNGDNSTNNQYSPNLNFHWLGEVSRSLTMTSDGNFTLGEWTSSGTPSLTGNLSFLNTAGYRVNNTNVIDSSRNLTNIGTISSGAITSTGDVRADTHFNSTDTNATLSATGSGNVYLRPNGKSSTSGQVHIATSGNATFTGTISSGAITSSGNIFMSTNGSILRNTGGALQLQSDASQVILRSNNTTALTIDTSQNATFTGNIVAEDSEVHVGDTSGDSWTRIKHAGADGYGFDWQHDNATVIVNEQGSTNQVMVLGDVDAANYSGLFGIAHSTNSGTSWAKKLDLKGNGELYIGSSGTNQVYHEGHKPTYSELGTMAYSNLTGTPTITTLSNGANNRIVTAQGVSSINAEANLQYDGSALDIYTGSIAVTDNHVGLTFRQTGTYSDGRYEHRFRKRDEGGGIPLYIDKTSSTANAHTAIARFGSYTSNPEEFQVYGKAKVADLHIKSGTSGTNTQGLLFTLTDNADAQAYIKKSAFYMHYNAHYNEGHRFTVNGTDDMLRMHGSNNSTRPDSIDILAANGLYMNNTQVMTQARALTNVTTATAGAGTNTTALANTAFVQQEITSLIGGAPGTLDTLNELAAAINDDHNYNSTLTTALATKLPKAGGTMTGVLNMGVKNITNADDIGMITGHSSGKFAVMATSVHGSYDFYNNGTSYFNGNVIVDANLTLSGGGQILGSPSITAGRVVTSGLYGTGHSSSTLPIWQYNAGNPGYGIAYTESSPDVLRFDVSNNLMSGTADLELRPNDLRVNGSTVWNAGNDGSGSGLDADTVDGYDVATTGANKILRTDGNNYIQLANWINVGTTGLYSGTYGNHFHVENNGYIARSGSSTVSQIRLQTNDSSTTTRGYVYANSNNYIGFLDNGASWLFQARSNGQLYRGNGTGLIWDSANDGSGSGLDADLLDGQHGNNYIGKNGNTYYRPNTWIDFNTTGSGLYWSGGTGAGWHIYPQSSEDLRLYSGASGAVGVSLETQGTKRGYVYANSSNQIGFLNQNRDWRFKVPSSGSVYRDSHVVWDAGNDGSGSGLDADTVDGWHASDFTHATASQTWSSIAAASTQAKRYHIARLYGCPAHWDSDWQNIELHVTAESYEAGTLKYKIHGNYGGAGSQANMIMMHLTEAYGDMIPRFRIILGSPVDAGWDHSGQDTYYVDVFAEASHYSNWKIHAKTFGHGVLSSNPSSGGAKTVFYSSPTASNISTFSENHTQSTIRLDTSNIQVQKAQTKLKAHSNGWDGGLALISQDGTDTFQIHPDNNGYMYVDKTWYFTAAPHVGSIGSPLWHPGNDGSGSGLDADLLDGVQLANIARLDQSNVFGAGTHSNYFRRNNTSNYTDAPLLVESYGGSSTTTGVGFHISGSVGRYLFMNNSGDLFWNSTASKIWHASNDGSGSGLDADLLDGAQGSDYVRSTQSTAITSGNVLSFKTSGGSERGFLQATDTNDEHFIIATSGGEDIGFKDGGVSGTTNMIIRGDGSMWLRGAIANGTIAYSQVTGTPTIPTNNNQLTNGAGYITASGNAATSHAVTGSAFGTTSSPSSVLEYQQASGQTDTRLAPTGDWYNTIRMGHGNPYNYYSNTIAMQMTGTGAGKIRTQLISNNSAAGWRTVWDSTTDGSGSGLDADLLDGLDLHTARNNEANKVVRTEANGYIQAGYINTNVGLEGLSHDWTRVYASTDGYIRPIGKSDFKVRMGLTAHEYDRMDYATGTQYHTGANSHNDTTFNGLLQRGCGFIDNWNGGAGKPPTGSHWNGFQALHYGNGSSYFHGMQMAMAAGNPSNTFLRGWWANGGSGYGWQKIWTDGNDGSGSGLDADLLDGQHASAFLTASPTSITIDGAQDQVISTTTHSLEIKNMGATGSGGLVLQGSSGTHGLQMYWDSNGAYYGFLDAAWANWDIQKARNGAFKVDEGNGLQRVWNAGNDGSGSGLDADFLDGYNAEETAVNNSIVKRDGNAMITAKKLYLNGGNYEGQIIFGAVDAWRTGIRQHDDGDAEMRIWAKNANGRIHIATGYDGQPASITRPTDGFVVDHNNVGIGNFSGVDPSQKLHVKGSVFVESGNLHLGNNAGLTSTTTGEALRVLFPGGGARKNNGSSETGAIKVTLPVGMTNSMLSFKITVYQYNTDDSFEVHVGGYNYPTGNTWTHNPFGYITSSPKANHGPYAIRFGLDSNSKACVYIGETNTTWSYPQIAVTEALIGYSAYTNTSWDDGWDVSIATSFENVTHTIAATDTSTVGWHPYNDGSGSGLDADLLDGVQLANIARTDIAETFTSNLTVNNNLYIGDGNDGYFYNDTPGRTAFRSGDFYIQDTVNTFYNYATNQYYGDSSGDNMYFRGNVLNGTGWSINGAGKFSTRDIQPEAGYVLMRSNHHSGHLEGSYNNVGGNGTKSNPIYTIGSSYNPGDAALSNMYGIGYTDQSASFINFTGAASWGMYVAADGDARVWLGGSNGVVSSTGQHYVGSNVVWNAGNDGSGSGLDADLLDGIDSTYFNRGTNAYGVFPGSSGHNLNDVFTGSSYNRAGFIDSWSGSNFPPGTSHIQGIQVRHNTGNHYGWQLFGQYNQQGKLFHRQVSNGSWGSWSELWNSNNDGAGSGLDADLLDGQQGSYYNFRTGGTTSGTITLGTQNALVANNYGRGLFGLYASTRYQHVWSMGTAYKTHDSGTSYGNMYGLTYTHTNVGTGTNESISGLSHQLQHRHNGTLTAAIGSGIWTSGNVTAYSDIAVKTNLVRIPNALEKVCSINGYTYERTDYVKDLEDPEAPDVLRQAGVVAQEIEKVLPEVVSGQDGNKAVAYGNVVALLIESIKELKDEVDELKKQLKEK